MISNQDLHAELKKIDAVLIQLEEAGDMKGWAELKTAELNTKLLYNIRTNMVTIMKHFDVTMKSNETRKEQ